MDTTGYKHILLYGWAFTVILAVILRALGSYIFLALIGSPVARPLIHYQPNPTIKTTQFHCYFGTII